MERSCVTAILPTEMEDVINQELKTAFDKKDCLKRAYNILSAKYCGSRLKIITMFWDFFNFNFDKLWHRKGFLYCTQINYLLKTMLVKSGFFQERDIQSKWSLTWWFFPHQYLAVKVDNSQYINVDLWAKIFGIEFGDYARGFHQTSVK